MIRLGKLLAGFFCACALGACSDDDRDDTILDMSRLTGKDWYYNAWLGDKNNFGAGDLLEVVRFEKGGTLKSIDFSGRREYIAGKWESDDNNRIILKYEGDEEKIWNVQHSGDDYIKTIVNAQGSREYTTDPGYLGNLTADAFWVNEYTSGNQYRTYIGADVRGNKDVREGNLLLADGNQLALQNHEFFWSEKSPKYIDDVRKQEVRFYLRIGKNTHLKLRDSLYSTNLPRRLPDEMNLTVNVVNGTLNVAWVPFSSGSVYYRVEVLSKDMDLVDPYFISRVQNAGSASLNIKTTTAGEVNRVNELKGGETYMIRLTALMYEPGIDPWNDDYGYANVQAVSYFTKKYLME